MNVQTVDRVTVRVWLSYLVSFLEVYDDGGEEGDDDGDDVCMMCMYGTVEFSPPTSIWVP